jgi:HlyD family secretion protein
MGRKKRTLLAVVIGACAVSAAAAFAWRSVHASDPWAGFVSGNGRVEAVEVDIATRAAGRVMQIMVDEGDLVRAGQVVALMDLQSLRAQRAEAAALEQQATDNVAGALAQVAMRRSDEAAAAAQVVQRDSEHDAAQRRLARSQTLAAAGAVAMQDLDDDRARVRGAAAAVAAAQAQREAAHAAVTAAQAQVVGARSAVAAAAATGARIEADLHDARLVAPRDGRIEYRVAQPGEVLAGGGKVLGMVDLLDVYMTFFVPETAAGRIALGAEVRLRLDTAPDYIIPARVSYIASVAQFTPKSVETASERQKLMFRVKAQVDRGVLARHASQVKAGVPGVAWLRLDPRQPWPSELALRGTP